MVQYAKITSRGQTTVPSRVRSALNVPLGGSLAWVVDEDGTVRVQAIAAIDVAYLRALEPTQSEWDSEEDERAYGGL